MRCRISYRPTWNEWLVHILRPSDHPVFGGTQVVFASAEAAQRFVLRVIDRDRTNGGAA